MKILHFFPILISIFYEIMQLTSYSMKNKLGAAEPTDIAQIPAKVT